MQKIVLMKDGPALVFKTPEDKKPAYALCRCGASTNFPYCTGAHQGVGWVATAEVIVLPTIETTEE